jgi:signal transduction histidine kinase
MNRRLLNKTTGKFLFFSVIILLLSAPVLYFIAEKLYLDETDETLLLHKAEFLKFNQEKFTEADIAAWNKYNRNIKIIPFNGILKDTLLNKVYFDVLENEDEPYRELRAPVVIKGKRYTYIEKNNLIEREDIIMSVALLFILIITMLMAGIIWISKRSSRKLWEPFYDTLSQIRSFEIDKNKPPQFIATNIEEFNILNGSIDRLIEKNTRIYKNQKEFIENAAHELQTPLALFQAKIDTLFQLSDLSEEQSVILDSLNSDLSRLNRLNRNLLLLSKIENEELAEKQPLVVNDYIKKQFDFFSEQSKAKNLILITEFSEKLTIKSNPGLAEVMINNFFLNAIRHNNDNGKIIIKIENQSLTFLNTGPQNTVAAGKLFDRFSKSNPSSKGNGLGLAIVKKITDLNGWQISYTYKNNLHSFTVKF